MGRKKQQRYRGLLCPLCGMWYCNDPSLINLGVKLDDVCGHNVGPAGKSVYCKGVLRAVTDEDIAAAEKRQQEEDDARADPY